MNSPQPTQHDKCIVEVCVDSVESAIAAIEGGADRLEVCASLRLGGGTTPSSGLVSEIQKVCSATTNRRIGIVVLVRPRVGDFLYTQSELAVMLADISNFAAIGVDGVAVGALTREGSIDVEQMRVLVERARVLKLEVCFHRAFDMVRDQSAELRTLVKQLPGVTRILTSGGKPKALAALPFLASLLVSTPQTQTQARTQSLEIMPGSGIDAAAASSLVRSLAALGLRSVHLSGGRLLPEAPESPESSTEISNRDEEPGSGASPSFANVGDRGRAGMLYRPEGMGMGVRTGSSCKGNNEEEEEWLVWRTDAARIRAVREAVDKAFEVKMSLSRVEGEC